MGIKQLDIIIGVVAATVGAYVFNAGGFGSFINSLIPWKIIYINTGPPSTGSGIVEDDVKSAAQIVVSVIQETAVTRPDPQTMQDMLDTIQNDTADRQTLIDLVNLLKSLTCVMTQAVCDDDESARGAGYIQEAVIKISTKYNIPLNPH